MSTQRFNVQLIATTHSYECVKIFNQVFPENTDAMRLFRIERDGVDNYKVVKYSKEDLEVSLGKEWEIR